MANLTELRLKLDKAEVEQEMAALQQQAQTVSPLGGGASRLMSAPLPGINPEQAFERGVEHALEHGVEKRLEHRLEHSLKHKMAHAIMHDLSSQLGMAAVPGGRFGTSVLAGALPAGLAGAGIAGAFVLIEQLIEWHKEAAKQAAEEASRRKEEAIKLQMKTQDAMDRITKEQDDFEKKIKKENEQRDERTGHGIYEAARFLGENGY